MNVEKTNALISGMKDLQCVKFLQFVLAHNMQIKSTFIIHYYDKVGYLVNIKSDTGRVRLIEFAYVQLLNGTTSSRNQFISKLFERLSYTRTYYPHIN